MKKRMISILLIFCMVVGLLPTTAFASNDAAKAIQLGTSGISGYDSTNGSYDYIHFGTWDNSPIKWRVLDTKTNMSDAQEGGGFFLLSDALLGTGDLGGVEFDNTMPYSNEWQGSRAQDWCNGFYRRNLSTAEQNAVLATSKSDAPCIDGYFIDSENILNEDKVFFLSAEEVRNAAYGFTDDNARIANYGDSASEWWLRSPHRDYDHVGKVGERGIVSADWVPNLRAARPAFNLKPDSVLLVSAAAGGKSADGIVKIPEYSGNEWKLTILDDTRTFKVTETAAAGKPGNTITLNFSGVRTGTNEYISVIIAGESGVTHYGRIMKPTATDTQFSFTIPYDLDSGNYKLYVFSEQCNGDYRTDYASSFQEVALTVEEAVSEQFALTPSGTYYFDLSGAGIPGTVNDALPDTSLHYVPFTYAGTVDAYKLTSEMVTTEEDAEQNQYPHSLFVADFAVTHTVNWNALNDASLIFGKNYAAGGVDYMLRAPSAGSDSTGLGDSEHGTPQSNEWDRILDKNGGYIKNWVEMFSWGQDSEDASFRAVRGYFSARYWISYATTDSAPNLGFSPVLEVLNPGTLGSDGLKVVTLDLGGGKLGSNSDHIQIIVKKGESFTAPTSEGLTRPDGDTGSYFMWLGSDGYLYAPSDNVPADVTKLTAQFDYTEQFTLDPGGTYYFDLSGVNIPGTVNDALPDKTMHYVPFTYAGTVNAYKLTTEMATTEEYAQQNKYAHSLFVADYAVTHKVNWNNLDTASLIFGKNYASGGVDYTLRAPSVGSNSTGSGDSQRGVPQSNEWDTMLNKNSGYIKNWSAIYSWGQDTPGKIPSYRAVRGYYSARYWYDHTATYSGSDVGFRPVLEVLNPGTMGSDRLKAVTLDLGGGKLGGSSEDIQIVVKNGESFTAPASDGLTRPDGDTGSYFMWLGSDGNLYEPSDSVPADVDKLTAQFDYIEQFALTLGGTYWFDLSGAAISGTVNGSLPDTMLHYVPFTYAGTVDAYKLISEMPTTDEYAEENAYRHSLFVADYAVTHTISWNDLNTADLIFGKGYAAGGVEYTLRAPSAGRSFAGSGDSVRGNPQSNEWDKILGKYDGYIKNYSNMFSWGQDTASTSELYRAARGYSSGRNWSFTFAAQSSSSYGFRPVLEVLKPDTLGPDGLKAVTLDLGGGKLGGSSEAIQIIVKNGESFTAPVFNGLTRPDGDTGSYFMWLGSDGNLYAPSANVPADVTKLTAQFAPSTVTITITTDSLPDGKVSEAYHHTLTADDTAPITWSIDKGRLPAGLSLNSTTGEISGAPIAEGTASFTVKAASSAGSGTKELRITIAAADPVEPVPYLDADGKRQVCTEYTVLKSNTANSILDLENKWYELPAGWYVVEGDVTITPRVDTQGEVNLILKDGCHFKAEWGINVKKGDTFTVYAQSTGEDTMGKLTACLPEDFNSDGSVDYVVWPYKGLSGIGGGVRWKGANNGIYESEGTIVINGGNIRAKGQDRASAIGGTLSDYAGVDRGGFFSEKRLGGSITINGGIVRTEAITRGNAIYAFSVGIGSCCSGYGGSVTINGGTVIAKAANSAISTGWDGSITINGGTVTATGGINNFADGKDALILGNGIGPYWNGTVTVNGGKIKASTAGQGSGIGGSRSPTEVIINGGEIEAVADQNGTGQYGAGSISAAGIGGVGSVSITGGSISATGNGGAAGIGGDASVSITGGEITVSATGTGAAIGGAAGEDCGSIHIQGDVLKSVSSVNGACIGAANGKGSGNITIANVKLPSLSGNYILIGWDVDSPGGTLTIRNSRVASTDIPTRRTDGIRVGSNSEIVIEESEIRLPHYRSVRAGDNGSIAVRDSDLHTYGIFMDETVRTITDAKTLKKLEITDSTVVTGDIIGVRGGYSSVEEIVIRNSNISLDSTDPYNSYSIGCGTSGSFGSIDIQNSTIDIPRGTDSAAIGSAMGGSFTGESLIRIADSQVTVACLRRSPAIGAGVSSYGNGKLKIYIENSNVTAKGGSLRIDSDYIPGIGRRGSDSKPEVYIQILDSTVKSLRHTKTGVEDNSDLVYDDLHEKNCPAFRRIILPSAAAPSTKRALTIAAANTENARSAASMIWRIAMSRGF